MTAKELWRVEFTNWNWYKIFGCLTDEEKTELKVVEGNIPEKEKWPAIIKTLTDKRLTLDQFEHREPKYKKCLKCSKELLVKDIDCVYCRSNQDRVFWDQLGSNIINRVFWRRDV